MQRRKLGTQGLEVSAIGLGCMGMTWAYGTPDEKEVLKTLHGALELGVDFWDTAEIYGPFKNEELLGTALQGKRKKVTLATKFGFQIAPDGSRVGLDSSPDHIRKVIEGSLKRLRTDYIDLYYQHRLDPNTPIEDTMGVLSAFVKEGKVRYVGLSEVGVKTLRRAHAVHPLSALQSEYSLWERDIEPEILPVLRELGIGLVAYSPVGRGFLAGAVTGTEGLEPTDFRRTLPRFQPENVAHNRKLVEEVRRLANARNQTPAQICLAWLLGQGSDIVPIPGTTKLKHLQENRDAAGLHLTGTEWETLNRVLLDFKPAGLRYTEEMMKFVDVE